jgi:hypothetical protein
MTTLFIRFFVEHAILDERDDLAPGERDRIKSRYLDWANDHGNDLLITMSVKDSCDGLVKYSIVFDDIGNKGIDGLFDETFPTEIDEYYSLRHSVVE